MRSANRIKPFLKEVEKIWLQNPDLRFSQLIAIMENNVKKETDIPDTFYIEDEQYLRSIERMSND